MPGSYYAPEEILASAPASARGYLPGINAPIPQRAPSPPQSCAIERPPLPHSTPAPPTTTSGAPSEIGEPASSSLVATAGEGEEEIASCVFNEQCQQRGLKTNYVLSSHSPLGYVGTLEIDGRPIHCEEPRSSKKAVRKWLAIQGLKHIGVTNLAAKDPHENWIGMLQEFLDSLPHKAELKWKYEGGSQGPFLCTVSFPMNVNPGVQVVEYCTKTTFPKRKTAKNAAAKAAVLGLVRAGFMRSDRSYSEAAAISPNHLESPSSLSCATKAPLNPCQKLADLMARHQLPPPKYDLKPDNPEDPCFFSGGVYFPRTMLAGRENFEVGGPIARVDNIYGQRKARQELAKQVLPRVKQALQERAS